MDKKKIVVFMGAGASKPFGHLLTKEIFPQIKKEIPTGELFEDEDEEVSIKEVADQRRLELKNYLEELLPGFNLKNLSLPDGAQLKEIELPLITDILSIVDHSLSISYAPLSSKTMKSSSARPSHSTEQMIKFRTLLEQAIFDVLVWKYDDGKANTSSNLRRFKQWIIEQAEKENQSLGIISTNYDIAVEQKLFDHYDGRVEKEFDFGFSWRDVGYDLIHNRPDNPLLRFYKLHGSLNWLRCELCERIYINLAGNIAFQAFRDKVDGENTCYCGHAPLRTVIVAPSLVRDVRDANLLEIWKNALELLRTADEWLIIGYSFPPEDIAIRSLFIRAYQGHWKFESRAWKRKPLKIKVVQHGVDSSNYSRYKLFFPECDYEPNGLEGFLDEQEKAAS